MTLKQEENTTKAAIISLIVVAGAWYFLDDLLKIVIGSWRYLFYVFAFFVGVGFAASIDNKLKADANLAKINLTKVSEHKHCGKGCKDK